ncbi:hypothetical protein ACIOHE_07000 [Streptomyces sp. NPDC087851]
MPPELLVSLTAVDPDGLAERDRDTYTKPCAEQFRPRPPDPGPQAA